MESRIVSIAPHENAKVACSAHGAAAKCLPVIADVVLRDAGSEHIEWAVCARWLRENTGAATWLGEHSRVAALLNAP
jgi:hypothetical protein